jgi:pyruvate/2-oxoglutarate dehydrogenase complex dihydrolipoamide acyltransferase (E2) component
VAQAAQRRARRREADDGRVPDRRVGRDAEGVPDFNASLDGEELVLRKRYYNIGFAADTPGGLVVPVIKDADQKGLLEIARELTELSGKAREGKLGPAT